MTTIILIIFILGILILAHEGGHFFAAKRSGVRVHEFGFGFPPKLFSRTVGETEYSVNMLPFGGFVRLEGEDGSAQGGADTPNSFANKPLRTKLLIVLAGVAMNWLLAATLFGFLSIVGAPISVPDSEVVQDARVIVTSTADGSPADMVGMSIGEQIIGLTSDTETVTPNRIEEVKTFLETHAGQEVQIMLATAEQTRTVRITPRVNPPDGEGAVGISLMRIAIVRHPWYEAPWRGVFLASSLTLALADGFRDAFTTFFIEHKAVEGLAGPIGIAYLTGEVRSLGFLFLVNFVAILSLNLALINILPFPALDGGRAVIAFLERIRGKAFPLAVLSRINAAGFAALLVLLVLVTISDFQNYIL